MSYLGLDRGTKKLIFILCLPLVDGVFATLLVTGAVQTFSEFISVALTVFSGAGAIDVLFSYSESAEEARYMVMKAVPFLVLGSVAVALVAPIFEQIFHLTVLRYVTGLALIVIAAQLLNIRYSEKVPVWAVVSTGLVLSLKNPGALQLSFNHIMPALYTAGVAGLALYALTYIRTENFTMSYIRLGSAAVLSTIALSLFGLGIPSEVGLVILTGSFVISARGSEVV
ncbi:MAG: DUF5794 domain-containing protein [Candidatus Aenigmatarchaeota archaeon]